MRILLQFPEGLKKKAIEYAKDLEQKGHIVFLASGACYGACDLPIHDALDLKIDKIIHFGHNKFIRSKLPIEVEYIPYKIDFDKAIVEETLSFLKEKDIKEFTLATTIQHLHLLNKIKEFYEQNGFKVNIYRPSGFALEPGQVLGCDSSAAKGPNVVFYGDGIFHVININAENVLHVNPLNKSIYWANDLIEKRKKRRKGMLMKALTCKSFGILLSTKPGQFHLSFAEQAKKRLNELGKEAHILVANELEPISIKNFMSFDCYISAACPRLSDDMEEFEAPVLDFELYRELIYLLSNKE